MKCTDKERMTCQVEKMGCVGCYYNDIFNDMEAFRAHYTELKRNKKIISNIDTDFYFESVDRLLKELDENKNKLVTVKKELEAITTDDECAATAVNFTIVVLQDILTNPQTITKEQLNTITKYQIGGSK